MHAAMGNQKAIVRRILHLGGDANTKTHRSRYERQGILTPLSIAARTGHLGMVRLLLKAGASQVVDGI